MVLATADNNGNLIIWKITDKKFRILANISNFSESTITFLQWAPDGDILFISNSNGSLSALELTEYTSISSIIPNQQGNLNKINDYIINDVSMINRVMPGNVSSFPGTSGLNDIPIHSQRSEMINTQKGLVKRIIPTLINSNSNPIINQENIINDTREYNDIWPNYLHNQYQCEINPMNQNYIQNEEQKSNPNKFIQDCIRCKKQKLHTIQTKISKIKLSHIDLENKNIYLLWENKVYDNYSYVQLMIEKSKVLYVNKIENKLIRLFAGNNFCYVIYDTMNLLNVYTLFNTMVIISFYKD